MHSPTTRFTQPQTPESAAAASGTQAPAVPTPENTWRVGTLVYTKAGLIVLFGWLLWSGFAGSLKDRSITPVFQTMIKKYEASDALTGVLVGSLPAVIGLLLGPIISYKSDRHRGRWGRRIPYLFATIPFTVIAMAGLGLSPWIGGVGHRLAGGWSPGLNSSILVSFGLCWTIFDFSNTVANSVGGGLVNDVVPQAILGRFCGLSRGISLIAGILFNYWIFGRAEEYYRWIFIGVGLFFGVCGALTCLKVREGQYPPPPVRAAGEPSGAVGAVKEFFLDCYGHGYYVWMFVASALANMAPLAVNLYTLYYAKSIGMSLDQYGKCIALTYAISLILSYPLGWLADVVHPLRLSLAAIAAYALFILFGGCFVHDVSSFAVVLVVHGALSGTFLTVSAPLFLRLVPSAKFAGICSAGGILSGLAATAMCPLLGRFLDHAGHDYRWTLFIGAGLGFLAAASFVVVHAQFMKLGGPERYVAPE